MLANKKILLGVCGSIAAYKAAYLIRFLARAEAEVQVLMTPSASDFITPLTLSTLSQKPVYQQFKKDETGQWNNHVALADWADAIVIAPLSANTLAKLAHGLCDNLLVTTYFSANCPVFLAPAMDLAMYQHPTTKKNLETVQSFGNKLLEAGYGFLASGLEGHGRMAEPEEIFKQLDEFFREIHKKDPLNGKTILITAGPTREPFDPVRYISNHSSGKMGFALANEAASRGAKVVLISGPTQCTTHQDNIEVIAVETAEEMEKETTHYFPSANIAILAAAVSDYKPEKVSSEKIKKGEEKFNISLEKTPDIAAGLGIKKASEQFIVGFALETENEEVNAVKKLHAKNMDLIVVNSLKDEGAGFEHETNKITILDRTDNRKIEFALKNKQSVAKDILDVVAEKINI